MERGNTKENRKNRMELIMNNTQKTKINMLYYFILEKGGNIPIYSDSGSSEPHYQKCLDIDFRHENTHYFVNLKMFGGSHTIAITAETYEGNNLIKETVHDVYSKDVSDFKNEYLSKIFDIFFELLSSNNIRKIL